MGKTILEKENRNVKPSGKDNQVPMSKSAMKGSQPDFMAIAESEEFKELMRKKKKFLASSTLLFLGLYLLFNVTISYTNLLDKTLIGDITWVWAFAFGLFIMTWVLVTVYMKRSINFDKMANDTLKKFNYDEEASK